MSQDRRWLELRVRAEGAEGHDMVPDALVEIGARGVIEEPRSHVAYFEEPADPEAFVAGVEKSLGLAIPSGGVRVEWRWQRHEEWAEAWKRGLGSRRITDRLVVHPSWKRPEGLAPGDVVIVLDPGMAFGTAEHGTTRGCLRLLDGVLQKGERVLDVGAGSGILAIAAARFGAEEVLAIEGDPLACEAMTENLRRNGVRRRVTIRRAWVDTPALRAMDCFDGVVANIETGRLIPLLPGLTERVSQGGWLLLSGLMEGEVGQVVEAVEEAGFVPVQTDADGEWRSVLLRRD